MGDKAKRDAVRELLDRGTMTTSREIGVTEVPDAPLEDSWLDTVRERRARFEADPEGELARYREFFKSPDMTHEDVAELLDAMELAFDRPEDFYDAMATAEHAQDRGLLEKGWKLRKIATDFVFRKHPSDDEKSQVAALIEKYGLDPNLSINPHEHQYEDHDPRWWPLLGAKLDEQSGKWPAVLAPYIEHDADNTFIYEARSGADHVALMADFGCGHYPSRAIAAQLTRHAFPYVFHLGDVYYKGDEEEFRDNYREPLEPVLSSTSTLFSIPENHELYSHGVWYLAFIREELARKRIIQQGSYFCVRFPAHQVVAIDVNWNGRQRFRHEKSRAWLDDVLRSGQTSGLTTILLTGSAPLKYGGAGTTPLYGDLHNWLVEPGLVSMWFWGDDHYCALFDRGGETFVGSCIGHAGFPGGAKRYSDKANDDCPVPVRWLETEPRFPRMGDGHGMRDDLTNNGWCHMTLKPGGGIGLAFIDWLGSRRYFADYARGDDGTLTLGDHGELGREPDSTKI